MFKHMYQVPNTALYYSPKPTHLQKKKTNHFSRPTFPRFFDSSSA